MTRPIDGPRLDPAGGGKPEKLVILFHGYGSNGDDLIGLARYWAPDFPGVQWVSPNAPDPVPMAPNGFQWFDISNLDPARIQAGAEQAAPIADAFIDQELERYGLAPKDLVLIGFSQGTMLSLQTGLRRDAALGGIIGFSGAMPGGAKLKDEMTSKPPIMMVHGDQDPVLPPAFMFDAVTALAEAGHGAEWHISPGTPHSIAQDGLDLGKHFLKSVFAR